MPDLVIGARRLAQSVLQGVHGRRQAGAGENFWQFRPFQSGEAANRIDWRRSARGHQAFVREREWEAAQTLLIWFDRTPSMRFGSDLALATKLDRAATLTLALAELAVRGGERVGLLGLSRPIAARDVIDRFAQILTHAPSAEPVPPASPVGARSRLVLIGDFLSDATQIASAFKALGAAGHVVMIADPVEETFPFQGHVEFLDTQGTPRWRAQRAQEIAGAYREKLAAQREAVRAAAKAQGWDFLLHRTDASAANLLLALHARLSEAA